MLRRQIFLRGHGKLGGGGLGVCERKKKLNFEGVRSIKRLQVMRKKEKGNFMDRFERDLLIHPCPIWLLPKKTMKVETGHRYREEMGN